MNSTDVIDGGTNETDLSGDDEDSVYGEKQVTTRSIVTYVGAGIAMAGTLFTLLSYVGYRKFHVKRPHIIMVNLCLCLFFYYLAYMISNHDRQSPGNDENSLCLFGAIVCHFTILAAWFWILVYWALILVMYRRPMGGHISHFFIKASVPSYGVPLIITIVCAVVAYQNEDMKQRTYVGPECFVDNMYLYFGAMAPFFLAFIPMIIVFGIIMHGIVCSKEEQTNTSNPRRNVKKHLIRLSIITILLAAVLGSSGFAQHIDREVFASVIVFGITSSILGSALLVLFCLNQKEIRSHWVSVIQGKDSSRRQLSLSRSQYDTGTEVSTYRKGSTLGKNHPSVYIEEFDDGRKSSTYRIVAKQDTDMSTLGLIEIPGTPSPARNNENGEKSKENPKVGRKKSDVSKMKIFSARHNTAPISPTDKVSGFDDTNGKADDNEKSRKKRKAHSTSSPARSPKHKTTKRQNTSDDIMRKNESPSNSAEKKKPKRANSSHRLSRFARKSTSTIDEETVQLTEFN